MTTKASVAVVDDDSMICEHMLEVEDPNFEVHGAFANVESLLHAEKSFDVVVLDMWIRPRVNGVTPMRGAAAINAVKRTDARVVAYTAEERPLVLTGLLAAGARGIVSKSEPTRALYDAIAEVAAGRKVLPATVVGMVELAQRHGQLPRLRPRHIKVLQLRARGLPWNAIAQELVLSPKTVQEYGSDITGIFVDLLQRVDLVGLEPDDAHSMAVIAKTLGLAEGDLLDTDLLDPDGRGVH